MQPIKEINPNPSPQDLHGATIQSSKDGVHSQNGIQLSMRKRQRVPQVLQIVIRGRLSEMGSKGTADEEGSTKQQKIGSIIKNSIKNAVNNIRDLTICQICETEMKKQKTKNLQVYMCDCEHQNNFCQSCLHHYVIYKVKTFEEVHCPHEGCPVVLDMNSRFFKSLPIDIQKNYKKISQFYTASKDLNRKMCPKQHCAGILQSISENVMVCNACKSSFCGKCLLVVHQGQCEALEVKFFENNLHYRQCKKCKFVIEKNQGCNHMTCRCGHQFCYVCGQIWSSAHYGSHDQNGQLIPGDAVVYENQPCCDCTCMNENCGQTWAYLLKIPLKLFVFIIFFIVQILIFIVSDLFVIALMVVISILAGLLGYSFELLSRLDGGMCILGVIFFPILMIGGVGVGFHEIFCDVVPDLCRDYWIMFGNGMHRICLI